MARNTKQLNFYDLKELTSIKLKLLMKWCPIDHIIA